MTIDGRARPGAPQQVSPQRSRARSGVGAASSLLFVLCLLGASPGFADSYGSDAPMPSDEGQTAPPPGTLGPDGMVPAKGAAEGPQPPEEIGHVPGPGEGVYGDPPNSGTGDPEDRPWAYDPTYFFALTHGLKTDTDLGPRARRWVSPLTLTMDVITLPTAALAGLSGRTVEDHPREAASSEPADSEAAPTAAGHAPVAEASSVSAAD